MPLAHILTYHLSDQSFSVKRYWQADFTPDGLGELSEEEIVSELTQVLSASVERRLISDVPIGFFLSGGIDSGLITALASQVAGKQIDTFTLTYPDDNGSVGKRCDRENARWIAKLYNTNHHEEVIDYPNFPDELPKIIQSFDEPFAGVVSTYFLSRFISKHVKVALTGDGADELFGSYLSHRMATAPQNEDEWLWRYKLLVFLDEEKRQLYSPEMNEAMKWCDTLQHLKGYFDGLMAKESLNRILEVEFKSIFPDQVLTYADRLSMAYTLELRSPYLDTDFVELVAKLPAKYKINNGETKYILKKMAARYLPAEIVQRPKEGFIMPVTEWLYKDLKDYVNDMLSPANLRKHGLFNAGYVHKLISDFYNTDYNYRRGNKLLLLIAFQVWYENYMENR